MKRVRYLIFLSILRSIFVMVYRHSDDKSFVKWLASFKSAINISVILANLIPNQASAVDLDINNNQPLLEKIVK